MSVSYCVCVCLPKCFDLCEGRTEVSCSEALDQRVDRRLRAGLHRRRHAHPLLSITHWLRLLQTAFQNGQLLGHVGYLHNTTGSYVYIPCNDLPRWASSCLQAWLISYSDSIRNSAASSTKNAHHAPSLETSDFVSIDLWLDEWLGLALEFIRLTQRSNRVTATVPELWAHRPYFTWQNSSAIRGKKTEELFRVAKKLVSGFNADIN